MSIVPGLKDRRPTYRLRQATLSLVVVLLMLASACASEPPTPLPPSAVAIDEPVRATIEAQEAARATVEAQEASAAAIDEAVRATVEAQAGGGGSLAATPTPIVAPPAEFSASPTVIPQVAETAVPVPTPTLQGVPVPEPGPVVVPIATPTPEPTPSSEPEVTPLPEPTPTPTATPLPENSILAIQSIGCTAPSASPAFSPTRWTKIHATQGYPRANCEEDIGKGEVIYCPADGAGQAPGTQRIVISVFGYGTEGAPENSCQFIGTDKNGNAKDIGRDGVVENAKTLGFDYYGLRWETGGGGRTYIQRNAFVLMELIEELQRSRGLTEEDVLVVVGTSMGGLVARYALSYMETNGREHGAKLFMTVDSPHRGAYVPLGVQHLTKYFAEVWEDEGAQEKLDDDINSPASRQMLLYHHTIGLDYLAEDPGPTDAFNQLYNVELRDQLGDYPQAQGLRKVAISHGRRDGRFTTPQGSALLIHWQSPKTILLPNFCICITAGLISAREARTDLSTYLDVKMRSLGSTSQPILTALPVFELDGQIIDPSSKRSVVEFLAHLLSIPVDDSAFWTEVRDFVLGPFADKIIAASAKATANNPQRQPFTVKVGTTINYEGAPGGRSEKTGEAEDLLKNSGTIMNTVEREHTFIPTVSALGLDLHPSSRLLEAIGDENVGPWDKIYVQESNKSHGEKEKTKQWVGEELAMLGGGGDGVAVVVERVVSVGGSHTCSTTTGGEAYCWGSGGNGQLGNGSNADQAAAVPVSGGLTFKALTAGAAHSCGITTGGEAYCWGAGGNGRLGNGSSSDQSTPVLISGGLTFKVLTAGGAHTCGITTGDEAYCWGAGANGRLGNGPNADQSTPVPVSGGLSFRWLSAGATHTCGVSKDFVGYCWGAGDDGQLGDESSADRSTPTQVSGSHLFVALAAGSRHTCGIKDNRGSFCWGFGGDGRLGTTSFASSKRPLAVEGSLTFKTLSVGADHTCGIWVHGGTYCWGAGADGQLGNGKTDVQPEPELVPGALDFTSVNAGGNHTCGITVDGKTYCWGSGANGQLGNGSTENKLVPTLLSPELP